jgi:two-component system sensor histidine kinase DevS
LAMVRVRSPGMLMIVTAYGLGLLLSAILVLALRMPSVGVSFVGEGSRILAKTPAGQIIAVLKPDAPVTFLGAGRNLVQPAQALASEYAPSGSFQRVRQWYVDRDLLGSILAAPGAEMLMPTTTGELREPLTPAKRRLLDLPIDVWLLLAQACAVGLVGVWMAVLRPNDWGARLFMVSCIGISLAAFSGGLADARELTANALLLRVALTLNVVGSVVGPAALIGLFILQPRRIAPPIAVLSLVALAAVWGLAIGAGLVPMKLYYASLLAMTAAFVIVLTAQWFLSNGDPAGRAIIRWVGLTSLVSTSALTIAMIAKQSFGGSSLGGDGLSILPIFIVYGAIAFGVGRYRVFDLDRWAFRVAIGALAAAALLLVDGLLIFGLRLGSRTALGLAMLVVAYLYFPARTWIWRWVTGKPRVSDTELFQLASDVAFIPAALGRRSGWRALLQRLFDPLEIAPADGVVPSVALAADGAALNIPAAADEGPLVLRYRNRGRRLFDSQQATLASELVKFMHQAERTRNEYARGAAEERGRIARDLHDDVSGRLLTGLQRSDIGLIRDEVRGALAEIRTILRGLSGELLPVSQMVANMRHETFERLDAAGIALEWPVELAPASDPVLDYAFYRNIISAHREVVTNILRHSKAKRAAVCCGIDAGVFRIVVADDGIGIGRMESGGCAVPRARGLESREGGRGIGNIQRRLTELGGEAILESANPGLRVLLAVAITPQQSDG